MRGLLLASSSVSVGAACMTVRGFLAGVALLAVTAGSAAAMPVTFSYTGGFQTFNVYQTGGYQITAFGAQGGGRTLGLTSVGGLGAEAQGSFTLTAGSAIQIAVGGLGGSGLYGGGGGGGSFVVLNNGSGPVIPLVIAGAGGGGASDSAAPGDPGQTTQSGSAGSHGDPNGGAGGTNGSGGSVGTNAAGPGSGGGGGGFAGDGASAGTPNAGVGGKGYPNLAGGTSVADFAGGKGGFGGGASGSQFGSGGGGGYSGGGGSGFDLFVSGGTTGGGGGSYVGSDVLPNTTLLLSGVESGDGLVTIEYLSPAPPPTEVPESPTIALLAAGLLSLGVLRRARKA